MIENRAISEGDMGKPSSPKLTKNPGHDELHRLYWIDNKSLTQIARLCEVSRTTVGRWMKKYGIKVKNTVELRSSSVKRLGREGLCKLYLGENRSIRQIASMHGVSYSTVKKWIRKYGIVKRGPSRILEKPSPDKLYQHYWGENKSTAEIARLYRASPSTVIGWMKKHNIPRRNREAISRVRARPFIPQPSPALGYVLGVLMGDGSVFVRKRRSGKRTYHVQLCVKDRKFAEKFAVALSRIGLNSSMRYLKNKGCYQAQAMSKNLYEWYKSLCLADGTPNMDRIRSWIKDFESQFICGFYESEGSIGFNKFGKLRMRMGNKRGGLLLMIQEILERYGVKSHLCGPGKYNYYDLVIYGDRRVSKLLVIIRPCIKTKPRSLKRCLAAKKSSDASKPNID